MLKIKSALIWPFLVLLLVACGPQTEPKNTPPPETTLIEPTETPAKSPEPAVLPTSTQSPTATPVPVVETSTPTPEATATERAADALSLLENALAAAPAESTYHFNSRLVIQSGNVPPLELSLDGDFLVPDSMQAVQSMYVAGIPIDELIVRAAGTTLATNMQTGVWEAMPGGGVDFSPEEFYEVEPASIENLMLAGEEELDGLAVYHLTGSVSIQDVLGVFSDLEDEVQIEFWIGRDDALIRQILLSGELAYNNQVNDILFRIAYSEYGKEVNIELPQLGEVGVPPIKDLEPLAMRNSYLDGLGDWSPDGNRLLFYSDRLDTNQLDRDIFLMDADGENMERLTWDPVDTLIDDVMPLWSPDGSRVLFLSTIGRGYDLVVMDIEELDRVRLTTGSAENASWSPDGTQIVFQSNRDGNYNIYVIDADGASLIQLTEDAADEGYPVWSPEGDRIAYTSATDDGYSLNLMDADGSNQVVLASYSAAPENLAWSPDGSRLAFDSDQEGEGRDIYVVNLTDASGPEESIITEEPGYDGDLAWSPNGEQIAFISERDGDFDLYVMDADGSNIIQLTNNPSEEYAPIWSPDGRHIAFTVQDGSGGYPDWEVIFRVDADGSNLVQLTQQWISVSPN